MRTRVDVEPKLLRWARERAPGCLSRICSAASRNCASGRRGETTFRQLEAYANMTNPRTAISFFPSRRRNRCRSPIFARWATSPFAGQVPTCSTRSSTCSGGRTGCEERIEERQEPLPFVGSATTDAAPARIAVAIRGALGLAGGWADLHATWSDALRALRDRPELAGIVVAINGVVGTTLAESTILRNFAALSCGTRTRHLSSSTVRTDPSADVRDTHWRLVHARDCCGDGKQRSRGAYGRRIITARSVARPRL
jgi:hypothetical protein